MVKNSILRKNARAQLGGDIFSRSWIMLIVVYLIYYVLSCAAIGMSCGITGIILTGPLFYGLCRSAVNVVKGRDVSVGDLFAGFNECFGQSLLLGLMTALFTFFWSLLFVIPGIVKSYAYAMAPYILQDDPAKTWKQCLDESREMMKGNKWQLFCLDFSFIGWFIVGAFCCCIGMLFVVPYQLTSRANFYMALKAENEPDYDPDYDPDFDFEVNPEREPIRPDDREFKA